MVLNNNTGQSSSVNRVQEIIQELNDKKGVKPITFAPDCTQFIIPRLEKYNEILIRLGEDACQYKRLIFSALYSACYQVFLTDTLAESNKIKCRTGMPSVIEYINSVVICDSNRISILKDYEEYRVRVCGVKPQSTNLEFIIKLIGIGIHYGPFNETLDTAKFNYLGTLTRTKIAPSFSVEQYTLTKWFAAHPWLRREDIGIGNGMYTRLASPKALTTSLCITAAVTLRQLQEAKYALISFFKEQTITPKYLSIPKLSPNNSETDCKTKKDGFYSYIYTFIAMRLLFLQKKYFALSSPSPELTLALEVILNSWCLDKARDDTLERFFSNQIISPYYNKHQRFSCMTDSWLFSHRFLYLLTNYAHSDKAVEVPVSNGENVLFQWLMAYQSVQISDIPKLKLSDFKFISRRNGRITHIESEYFKGRSNTTHHLNSVKANSDMGVGIINFINDRTANQKHYSNPLSYNIKDSALTTGRLGCMAQLIRLMGNSTIRNKINDSLQRKSATPVFIESLYKIIENGISFISYKGINNKKNQEIKVTRENWRMYCIAPSCKFIFGLSLIKNSSIHARSDSFTPTQIQNYNSHTNSTERESYRTKDNLEWLNNCGLVTREVMRDMHINVFSPSKSDIQLFNSEFTKTTKLINLSKADFMSRLKLVTGKINGRVDELGFLTSNQQIQGGLIDDIYLVDSPETVMRLYHYIGEVEKRHKKLAIKAIEYLLLTVLPTVEWMSILLAEKRFSKESLNKGKELFDKYEKILPTNFSAQLGS